MGVFYSESVLISSIKGIPLQKVLERAKVFSSNRSDKASSLSSQLKKSNPSFSFSFLRKKTRKARRPVIAREDENSLKVVLS